MSEKPGWGSWNNGWAQVIARSWLDEDYRRELQTNPERALAQQGLTFPPDVEVSVAIGSDRHKLELAIPARPQSGFDESDLSRLVLDVSPAFTK